MDEDEYGVPKGNPLRPDEWVPAAIIVIIVLFLIFGK